jgi:CheY-like chemotaxis protein
MPIMSGLESSREIRRFEQEEASKPVTIIALTALASEAVQKEAFASGINFFLTKPVRLKELGLLIEEKRSP